MSGIEPRPWNGTASGPAKRKSFGPIASVGGAKFQSTTVSLPKAGAALSKKPPCSEASRQNYHRPVQFHALSTLWKESERGLLTPMAWSKASARLRCTFRSSR
ncbi:expressed protein [Pseudozyma hubeiensis SY62]|uniref:Expressed protein n=1 Tax=Pseudozyma hubeiensis (strain SY62) TaxID=1305764 RepID=R9PJ45_PSEHS|nr:expressed protein [Pseudozyma hubeiensis SY62]GAC98145.1 expressed protein [Pseudozyma hubeiensis SY62]